MSEREREKFRRERESYLLQLLTHLLRKSERESIIGGIASFSVIAY